MKALCGSLLTVAELTELMRSRLNSRLTLHLLLMQPPPCTKCTRSITPSDNLCMKTRPRWTSRQATACVLSC